MKAHMTGNLVRRAQRWMLAASIACGVAGSAHAEDAREDVQQPDVARAEGHAAQAYKAYADKDYSTAVRLYRQAYAAAPAPDILYNIARIYEIGLHDAARAIQFYRKFIADPDADAKRIEIAGARLQRLEEAKRRVPNDPAPETPSDSVLPAPNDAIAAASAPELPKPAPPPSSSLEGPAVSTNWSRWRVGALVAAGAGLTAMGVGAAFGIDALSQARTVREDCDGNACMSSRGVSAARAAAMSANVATVSFALGGVLLATGAALLWIDLDGPPDQATPRLSWSPRATSSELGLALSGRW
jgi:hypothetical protein